MGGWPPHEKLTNQYKIQKCSEIELYVSYRLLDWTNLHEILRRKRWWYSQEPKTWFFKVYGGSENRDFMGGSSPHGYVGWLWDGCLKWLMIPLLQSTIHLATGANPYKIEKFKGWRQCADSHIVSLGKEVYSGLGDTHLIFLYISQSWGLHDPNIHEIWSGMVLEKLLVWVLYMFDIFRVMFVSKGFEWF